MKGKLSLTLDRRPQGAAIVRLEGSIDAATLKQLEAAFRGLDEQRVAFVVVDMALLEYINSSGLSLLISAKTERAKNKGDVVLVRPQNAILNILKILGLGDFFRVASSVDQALLPPD